METLSKNINEVHDEGLTIGERLADRVAAFGGSWCFIGLFAAVCVGWMALQGVAIVHGRRPWDPYPYILLNLCLSCLAAIQAPVILMSQNRQEKKDRLRAEHDYEINLKAELEIQEIKRKLDIMMSSKEKRAFKKGNKRTHGIPPREGVPKGVAVGRRRAGDPCADASDLADITNAVGVREHPGVQRTGMPGPRKFSARMPVIERKEGCPKQNPLLPRERQRGGNSAAPQLKRRV